MKKYLLGIFAVVFAFSLSAFQNIKPKAKLTDPYWFKISGQHLPGSAVPQSDALFIQQSATAPMDPSCTTSSTYDCVAGFDQSQVNTSTNTLNGTQTTNNVPYTKAN
jgi:hypothetical protein